MGLTYRRSISILRWLRINLSGKGIGFSVGPRGAKLSIGPSGTRFTASKSGLQYRKGLSRKTLWQWLAFWH